jgi:hypothetical protein
VTKMVRAILELSCLDISRRISLWIDSDFSTHKFWFYAYG